LNNNPGDVCQVGLFRLGIWLQPPELNALMEKLDEDGGGEIDLDEFVAWYALRPAARPTRHPLLHPQPPHPPRPGQVGLSGDG